MTMRSVFQSGPLEELLDDFGEGIAECDGDVAHGALFVESRVLEQPIDVAFRGFLRMARRQRLQCF